MQEPVYNSVNEEIEIKAVSLIVTGMEMLMIQSLEKYRYEYRTHLLQKLQSVIDIALPEFEQKYWLSETFEVHPTQDVQELKYLVKNLENAMSCYIDETYPFPENYHDD